MPFGVVDVEVLENKNSEKRNRRKRDSKIYAKEDKYRKNGALNVDICKLRLLTKIKDPASYMSYILKLFSLISSSKRVLLRRAKASL
jgi:hypothetical protein